MSIRGVGDRWLAGEAIDGVKFGHNDDVEVVAGSRAGARGRIVLLIGLQPEPEYLVKLGAGRDVRVRQSALGASR